MMTMLAGRVAGMTPDRRHLLLREDSIAVPFPANSDRSPLAGPATSVATG